MLKPNSQTTTNLIRARELIADEKNWCTGFAFGPNGTRCAIGALIGARVDVLEPDQPELHALEMAGEELFNQPIVAFVNDQLGHAAVMRMFDRAIELSLQDA